jgi:hypothetical protein
MSFLKLTWCQLLRIILAQLGGNPLQQMYSQLQQGLPTMAPRSGLIPNELTQIRELIQAVTDKLNAVSGLAGDLTNVVDAMTNEFFENPIATPANLLNVAIGQKQTAANTRIATLDPINDAQEIANLRNEVNVLTNTSMTMSTFVQNTNRLAGVSSATSGSGAGGCSLQDLLGSGCTPNNDVPDVDLQALVDSLKQGDAIVAIKEKLVNASGLAEYQAALTTFNTTISGFNASFTSTINKAAIRNAVTGQITQIVFNLLSGCANQVYDLTLKSNVKNTIAGWTELLELQRSGEAYIDLEGNVVTTVDTPVSTLQSNLVVNVNFDRDL